MLNNEKFFVDFDSVCSNQIADEMYLLLGQSVVGEGIRQHFSAFFSDHNTPGRVSLTET